MELSEIWIYPVKSLGGIRVQKAQVLAKGLEYDRRYMLVDDRNRFITQRAEPQLALFRLSFGSEHFRISHGSDFLEIPLNPKQKIESISATVWDDTVQVFELGNAYSKWFSEKAGIKCKLIYFPEENSRNVDKNYVDEDEQVSLADGFPFLIIGQRSLEALNLKLAEPVPMNRFRPNFVFEGKEPFEEDSWKHFSIGANRFIGSKLCDRCVLTTVNQDTGQRGREPLATLSTFRKSGSKVNFGQNLVAVNYDTVFVRDAIKIESFH